MRLFNLILSCVKRQEHNVFDRGIHMNTKASLPFDIAVFNQYPEIREINYQFVIIAVLSGQLIFKRNNELREMTRGQMIFLRPQDYFSIQMQENTEPVFAFLSFQYHFFLKNFPNQTPNLILRKDYYTEEAYMAIYNKTLEFIDKYFSSGSQPGPTGTLAAYDYIYFLQEHAINQPPSPEPMSKKEQRILNIKDFIERNYTSAITLNDMAAELDITPQYLATFIKQNMNMTFNQYLYKIRLSYAVRDLVNTDESITHIAFNYGFPNVSAFNRIFKQEYQKTPLSYRAQYKKNLAYFNIEPVTVFDYEKSLEVYQNFIINKSSSLRGKKYHTDVYLDARMNLPLPHIWSRILNIGYGNELNDFSLHEQLRELLRDIPFEYGRITGIFHPDIMAYDPETKSYNFHESDTILDILYELQLTPIIVLGKPEPVFSAQSQPIYVYSANEFPDFSKAFRAFVKHCIQRFGIGEFERWRFEFSYNLVEEGYFAKNQFYYNFLKNSVDAYKILKTMSLNSRFGGPGHRLAQSPDAVLHILKLWEDNGIHPDFITLCAYPVEREVADSHTTKEKVFSTNPRIQRQRVLELKQALKNLYKTDIPLSIIEMSYYFINKRYISDSRFSAAYFINNVLDLFDLCDSIAFPAASDLHYQPLNSTLLLGGNNGLMTIDGIRKPPYFSLLLLHNLGHSVLGRFPGCFVTRHRDGSYRLLLYNYKHPNNYYCMHPDFEITEKNFNDIFTDQINADYHIHLNILPPGEYFINEYTLDKEHGSILDKWLSCGKGTNLLHHMILHLKEKMNIDFTYHPTKVDADTIIHYSLEPHVLKLVVIYPAGKDSFQ